MSNLTNSFCATAFIVSLLCSPCILAQGLPGPKIGAIRWDAWIGDKGGPGRAVQTSLGPEKWHYRLPFFAKVTGPDTVQIDGTSQEVMDREIDYAAQARLSYWAFVMYGVDDPMSIALYRYLSSGERDKIEFSLITAPQSWSDPAWAKRIEWLMTERGYLTVLHGRPVLYMLGDSKGSTLSRKAIDDFRADVIAKGLKNPYIVLMDFSAADGKRWLDVLGADAISSYDSRGDVDFKQPWTYPQVAHGAETFWDQCKATGAQVVPVITLTAGRAPRIEHPVPWEKSQKQGDGNLNDAPPTPKEMEEHVVHAFQWLRTNRASAQAQIAITYAWNENDEGGWLVPTLSEGTARIHAMAAAIDSQTEH
jgi:hypothetical protein